MTHDLISRASAFHAWDAMAPAALASIGRRGPFEATAETGCGGSTIVLSQVSKHHTVFAIEGENRTITALREHEDLERDRVEFVVGESKDTVPGHRFSGLLDLVLLDGPHAYPWPQLEFGYLYPKVRAGGWLVLDDLQIRSVYELFEFLRQEPEWVLEEVAVRTAFFRRLRVAQRGPDGWEFQGMNRSTIWRYSWRDKLRRLIGRT